MGPGIGPFLGPQGPQNMQVLAQNIPFGGTGGSRRAWRGRIWSQIPRAAVSGTWVGLMVWSGSGSLPGSNFGPFGPHVVQKGTFRAKMGPFEWANMTYNHVSYPWVVF